MSAKPIVKLSKKKKISNPVPNDVVEGYVWTMKVGNLPAKASYTIFQSIDNTIYSKSGAKVHKDKHLFTEMWHKKSRGNNTDAFVVPRWWRTPPGKHFVEGYLKVKAKVWVVEGNVSFKSLKAKKGRPGKDPWVRLMGSSVL